MIFLYKLLRIFEKIEIQKNDFSKKWSACALNLYITLFLGVEIDFNIHFAWFEFAQNLEEEEKEEEEKEKEKTRAASRGKRLQPADPEAKLLNFGGGIIFPARPAPLWMRFSASYRSPEFQEILSIRFRKIQNIWFFSQIFIGPLPLEVQLWKLHFSKKNLIKFPYNP